MRKTNIIKILEIFIFLFVFSLIFSGKTQAVNASVYANNCNVGEKFNITVDIGEAFAYECDIVVEYSDGSEVVQHCAGVKGLEIEQKGYDGKVPGYAYITVKNLKLYDNNEPANLLDSPTSLRTQIMIIDSTPADNNTDTPVDTTPEPPVVLSFTDVNEIMYTDRRVNVRSNYGTDSSIIQTLASGTEVIRTGISDGTKDGYSWSRISYGGTTGYLITSALTDEAPIQDEEPIPEEPAPEETPEENTETPLELSEEDKAKIEEIAKKFGTIPQVGVNIMPFMFLGSCVSCIILMIIIKKESCDNNINF